MKVCVLTDSPCIFNGGFSQRVRREIDLLSSSHVCDVYYYTFFALSKYKSLKETPNLSNETNMKNAVTKVLNTCNIKDIETRFIVTSRLRRLLPDSAYDKFYANKVINYVRKNHIDILLCENLWCSYIGYLTSQKTNVKFIFDYHGVVPEEHKFFNNENEDWNYFYLKQIEKISILRANHIICVSNKFKEYLIKEYCIPPLRIDVVPCCVSQVKSVIREQNIRLKNQLGLRERKVIVYAGSITKYQCMREMAFLFSELIKRDNSFYFLFLSAYRDYDVFDKLMKENKVSSNYYALKSIPQEEVHDYLCMSDYALIIREDHLLNRVASPTKIAEYLMAGLPIIGTNCIGDLEDIPSAKLLFDYTDLNCNVTNVAEKMLEFDRTFVDRESNIEVARRYVQSKLVWSSYIKLYTNMLLSLC